MMGSSAFGHKIDICDLRFSCDIFLPWGSLVKLTEVCAPGSAPPVVCDG
jgi:hypothetical protein